MATASAATSGKIVSRFQEAVREGTGMTNLDFSKLQGAPAAGVQSDSALTRPRSLGDLGNFRPNRPAPDQADMDNLRQDVVIRPAHKAVREFVDGEIERILGRMRRHMSGPQFLELYGAKKEVRRRSPCVLDTLAHHSIGSRRRWKTLWLQRRTRRRMLTHLH